MKIKILGSAACIPHPERANTCLLIEDSLRYLIECPGHIPFRLAQLGIDLDSIDAILISHFHADHFCGLSVLLKSMELLGRKQDLWIVGPSGLEAFCREFMKMSFGRFQPEFKIKYRELGSEFESIPEIELNSARMDHGIECYGFRINDACYSSDTRPCPNLVELAKGCRLLFHDSSVDSSLESMANSHGHSSAAQAGQVAAAAGVEKLILIHLESIYRSRESDLIKDASRWFQGEILVARDLMDLQI